MFEKLTLTNFQSHESTEIAFGPRVTVVHGPTNNGKSAVFRALDWVCNNGLDGDYFLSSWLKRGGRCAVTLTVDGHTVTRERSKSDNLYTLDGTEHKAFGKGVPDAIAALLNLSPHTFQRQGDQPFLISGTGSAAAEVFNTAAGLADIDAVESELRRRKAANDEALRLADRNMEEAGRKTRETAPWLALRDLIADADGLLKARDAARASEAAALSGLGRLGHLRPCVTFDSSLLDAAADAAAAVNGPRDALRRAQDALQALGGLRPCAALSDSHLTRCEALVAARDATRNGWLTARFAIGKLDMLRQTIALEEPAWPARPAAAVVLDVKRALSSLNALKAPAAVEGWHRLYDCLEQCFDRMHKRLVEHNRTAIALSQLADAAQPDTAGQEALGRELAQFDTCPGCGAKREHWNIAPRLTT